VKTTAPTPPPRPGKRRSPEWWATLPNSDRYAILNLGLAIVWAVVFAMFTPEALAEVLNRGTTLVFVGYIIVGSILAIIGRIRRRHTTYELSGLSLIIAGLLFYFVVQFSLGVISGNPDRYALAVLAFWLTSTFFERYHELLHHFIPVVRRWIHDGRAERKARADRRSRR
jgi:hypothetical protein